jgi:hypothetical protein
MMPSALDSVAELFMKILHYAMSGERIVCKNIDHKT